MNITAIQKALLLQIQEYIMQWAYPPTIQELADEMGYGSKNTVSHHLKALEAAGYITRRPGEARTIRVIKEVF
ncbi:MAG: helix-turn-helix domain-containing protein [bacterium]|nr:helix-turn-helix domain-containing protein [bacterium]